MPYSVLETYRNLKKCGETWHVHAQCSNKARVINSCRRRRQGKTLAHTLQGLCQCMPSWPCSTTALHYNNSKMQCSREFLVYAKDLKELNKGQNIHFEILLTDQVSFHHVYRCHLGSLLLCSLFATLLSRFLSFFSLLFLFLAVRSKLFPNHCSSPPGLNLKYKRKNDSGLSYLPTMTLLCIQWFTTLLLVNLKTAAQ